MGRVRARMVGFRREEVFSEIFYALPHCDLVSHDEASWLHALAPQRGLGHLIRLVHWMVGRFLEACPCHREL